MSGSTPASLHVFGDGVPVFVPDRLVRFPARITLQLRLPGRKRVQRNCGFSSDLIGVQPGL
jgi:hypothetical protein